MNRVSCRALACVSAIATFGFVSTWMLPCAFAQEAVPRVSGHPAHVASTGAVTDVRAFAVARADDRVLIAYVQAVEYRSRGSLRTALLRGGADGSLDRVDTDHTLAPAASAVALSWDGRTGAVVYTIARPHRGEPPGTHRPRTGGRERSLADPLGASTLTAADVMFQRIDENGAPVGRPVLLFEENARAFRVAVAPDGDGWQVAWTGAMSVDDEIRGTVRTTRVNAQGTPRSFASETGFAGQTGDVLRVIAPTQTRRDPWVLFSGERCTTRLDLPPHREPTHDPSAAIETHPRAMLPQQPAHEHNGAPIVCDPMHLFVVPLHADGTSGPIGVGPALATDALSVVDTRRAVQLVAPLAEHGLSLFDIDPLGHIDHARTLQPEAARTVPPQAPDAVGILRSPFVLDASNGTHGPVVFALSPTHARIAIGTYATADAVGSTVLIAPATPLFDLAVAWDGDRVPWLFAQSGTVVGGPLVYVSGAPASMHAADPEGPWAGDERFMQSLLRARAARAAYTAAEAVYGPLSERPDAATNPNLPGLAAGLRRLRAPWDLACESLRERARYLSRHGVDPGIQQLAAEQCEVPPEPVVPGATGVPGVAPPP